MKTENPDKLEIKQKKGLWKRFIKVFFKCHLPFFWLIAYVIIDILFIQIGISVTDDTAALFAGDTSPALVTGLIISMVVNLLLGSTVTFVGALTSARINRNMRGALLEKILKLPMSYFKEENPRDAIYRITENATVIDSTIMLFLIPVFSTIYTAVSVFIRVFGYDIRLSAVLLLFIPFQVFIAFLFGRLNFSLNEKEAGLFSKLSEQLSALVVNIPLAKAFAKEKEETEKGAEYTKRLYRLSVTGNWLDQFRDLSESALSLIQAFILALIGMFLLRDQAIEIRTWIAFFMFSTVFNDAVSQFITYWNNIKLIQGGASKVIEIMDAPEEDEKGEPCTDLRGNLLIKGVHFGYDPMQPVFSGLSCEFEDNKINLLLGTSGSGKTTLINLLNRLYEPEQGAIFAGEKNISDYALSDYRKQFVVVSQNPMIFSGSIRENLVYGNEVPSDERLKDALVRSGSYDFVMAMEGGMDSSLEEYGNNLSGGQKQRLAMARALLSDAHYLILDEPTAAMDAIAERELMDVLREVAKGRCMIIIAHTRRMAELADRVVVIEDSATGFQGTVEEIKEKSRFLYEFIGGETV